MNQEEIEKDLGEGPLTLGIFCTRCNSQFELNKKAVAMAVLLRTSFIEFLRYVQSSRCRNCASDKQEIKEDIERGTFKEPCWGEE